MSKQHRVALIVYASVLIVLLVWEYRQRRDGKASEVVRFALIGGAAFGLVQATVRLAGGKT